MYKSCGRLDKIASGVSEPIDPIDSLPFLHIGIIMVLKSSFVYPKILSRVSKLIFSSGVLLPVYGILLKGRTLSFTHFLYGCLLTISFLISSSSTILPAFISTKNIFPGSSLPCFSIFSGLISITPVSDDITTYPSLVTVYLEGLKPLRSKRAPMYFPSVNGIDAGPSQGSIKQLLNS